jgi:hypothetical protein
MAEQSKHSKSAYESNQAVYEPDLRIEVKNLTSKKGKLLRGVYKDKTSDLAGILANIVSNDEPAVRVRHEDDRALNSCLG